MASAGRILIMPKGNYNSGTTYEMLDLVNHNGKSWLAKKTSVGIEPSDANSEYWQNMFDITAETFGALSTERGGYINGDVFIKGDWVALTLINDDETRRVILQKSPDTNMLSLYNYMDSNNYNNIMLLPETYNVADCFALKSVVNGTVNTYQIFGQHNIDLLNQYIDARIEAKLNNN